MQGDSTVRTTSKGFTLTFVVPFLLYGVRRGIYLIKTLLNIVETPLKIVEVWYMYMYVLYDDVQMDQ